MLKRTPLFDEHTRLGARFAPFAGWEMPIVYTAISEEHEAVRSRAGLFDISHMGEITIEGSQATEAIRRLATNDPDRLRDGGCHYSLILNDRGGILDDIIVSRRSSTSYLICVNAANTDKIVCWAKERLQGIAAVSDSSADYGQIALQGPLSPGISERTFGREIPALKPFRFVQTDWLKDIPLLISRTGYTGEDGFEITAPWGETPKVWAALMESGRQDGLRPIGLAARDTLRLEAALPLYGQELTEETDPFEAGLGWVVKPRHGSFIGAEALARKGVLNKEFHPSRRLIGFEMSEPGIARMGHPILHNGKNIGVVTSGTMSPTLGKAIGLGFVAWGVHEVGTEITIDIRGRFKKAKIVKTPFVRKRMA